MRRRSGKTTTYRTPGYPLTPIFFLLIIGAMLYLLARNNTLQAFLGVGIVLLGVPVYHLMFRKKVISNQ